MSEKSTSQSPSQRHNYMTETWVPKIKRRRRFSTDETKILEKEYNKNSSPNQEKIQDIANVISTPRKIVTTWFQNRRAKNKRKERARTEEGESSKERIYLDDDEDLYKDEVIVPEYNEEYKPIVTNYYNSRNDCEYSPEQIENMIDLPMYTNILTTSPIPHYTDNIREYSNVFLNDANQQYIFPQQSNQFFSLPTTNQAFNINVYNNMNNYYHYSPEQNLTRTRIDLNSQQQTWYNYSNYQQQYQQPQENILFNRNFLFNNNFNEQIYINPSDIYLNQDLSKEEEK